MTGRSSRRKGADYERALVHIFRAAMPGADIKRGFQSRDGAEAPDVDAPHFWIEAKRGRCPNIRGALRQAAAACGKGRMPIAIVRDDRRRATVTMYLDDFLDLVGEWWALGRQ